MLYKHTTQKLYIYMWSANATWQLLYSSKNFTTCFGPYGPSSGDIFELHSYGVHPVAWRTCKWCKQYMFLPALATVASAGKNIYCLHHLQIFLKISYSTATHPSSLQVWGYLLLLNLYVYNAKEVLKYTTFYIRIIQDAYKIFTWNAYDVSLLAAFFSVTYIVDMSWPCRQDVIWWAVYVTLR
jgi:hypothetical protein